MDGDSELLRRYAEHGSEEAFRELVQKRMGLVYGSALRQLGNVHAAQEVAQVVFTDLARKARSLAGRPVLASWRYTSTHYAVANVARKERRRQAREQEAYHMQDSRTDDAMEAEWERLRPVIDAALNGLDGRERDAVLLRCHQGRSFAEVGEALNLSEEAARKRVHRALEKLRVHLSSKGITSSAAALSAVLAVKISEAAPVGFPDLVSKTALMQAAGAGVTAGSLLAIMSAVKGGLGTGALAALLAVGAAVYEVSRDTAASNALAASSAQLAATNAAIRSTEGKVQGAEQALAAKERKAVAASEGASGSQGGALAQDSKSRGDAFMERHPEVRSALLAFVDARDRTLYGPLLDSLGLSPDQIAQFEVLQRRGFTFGRDIGSGVVTFAAGDSASDDSHQQQAQLKALLGDSGYKQYQDYSPTIGARETAAGLASALATSDTPLSTEQAQQVEGILNETSIRQPPFGYDWATAYAKAQGVLSPPQLDVLQAIGTQAIGWQQAEAAPH